MPSGDKSNKIDISFTWDRCLYARSAWTTCSLCVESCPGKAIMLPGGHKPPVIDSSRCMQCGQCLSACPLDAFSSARFSERQLLNRVNPDGPVRLECFVPKRSLPASLGTQRTYHMGACLAALTPGALFELAYDRVCELSTETCRECVLFRRLEKTMELNFRQARLLLADWGRQDNLRETEPLFLPDSSQGNGETPGEAGEGQGLGERVGSGGPSGASSAGMPDPKSAVRSSIRSLFHGRRKRNPTGRVVLPLRARKRHVPFWRTRLHSAWDRHSFESDDGRRRASSTAGGEGGERFPWPRLVVDAERCRGCGTCMQMCPTGAIRHSMVDGMFSYEFTPGICVNCGLCLASCAASVLRRDYQPLENPFDEQELCSRPAEACVKCGRPVLDGRSDRLCYVCSSKPDPKPFLDKAKRQMTEFLNRGEKS